jgi:hypothetical protein
MSTTNPFSDATCLDNCQNPNEPEYQKCWKQSNNSGSRCSCFIPATETNTQLLASEPPTIIISTRTRASFGF